MTNIRTTTKLGRLMASAVLSVGTLVFAAQAPAQTPTQARFDDPQKAVEALAAAAKARDLQALTRILGPRARDLVSGDAVRDDFDMQRFSELVAEKVSVDRSAGSRAQFLIGELEWPFPIPVVEEGGSWRFDTEAGMQELLDRRVGENERTAILLCRAYVLAQCDYFARGDWDSDGVAEYAQRLRSSPGRQDGLYWPTVKDDPPSPLAGLVTAAEAQGYEGKKGGDGRVSAPFLGYYFKLLTRQGPSAAGGSYGYLINGNMIGGYALVAYPVTWGNSGVMTFIVNQQGRVYQKNLGPNTAAIAGQIETYDPEPSWSLVADE